MDIMNYKVAKLKGSYSVEFNCEQKSYVYIHSQGLTNVESISFPINVTWILW